MRRRTFIERPFVEFFCGSWAMFKGDWRSSPSRTGGANDLPAKPADDVTGAVHSEQVGATFHQIPIAIIVNVVNAGITAAVVAANAPTKLALLWFGAVTLVSIGRWLLWRLYQRATPKVQNVRTWGILLAIGSLLAGLSWGLGGAVLLPPIPGLGQTFFILVIGGMCAGAVVLNAPHLPTLLGFLLSASLPVVSGRLHSKAQVGCGPPCVT